MTYTAQPYDHGFARRHLARHFDHLDEALVFVAGQRGGRITNLSGRCVEDITWYAIDDETGTRYRPDPQHREAARILEKQPHLGWRLALHRGATAVEADLSNHEWLRAMVAKHGHGGV